MTDASPYSDSSQTTQAQTMHVPFCFLSSAAATSSFCTALSCTTVHWMALCWTAPPWTAPNPGQLHPEQLYVWQQQWGPASLLLHSLTPHQCFHEIKSHTVPHTAVPPVLLGSLFRCTLFYLSTFFPNPISNLLGTLPCFALIWISFGLVSSTIFSSPSPCAFLELSFSCKRGIAKPRDLQRTP